jgi:hypothetical protein
LLAAFTETGTSLKQVAEIAWGRVGAAFRQRLGVFLAYPRGHYRRPCRARCMFGHTGQDYPLALGIRMKTLTAKDAKGGFSRIDLARAEPVAVAKHKRPPVVVMTVEGV